MNTEALIQNVIDQMKEAQLKLGYVKETMRFYYPAESLGNLIDMPELTAAELVQALHKQEQSSVLGNVQYAVRSASDDAQHKRIEVSVPPEGAEYVYRHVPTSAFLKDLIELFGRHHHCKLQEICEVFARYSADYVCEKMPETADFDYVIYFTGDQVDPYYYCIKEEMEHTIYHRFTKTDYEALLN